MARNNGIPQRSSSIDLAKALVVVLSLAALSYLFFSSALPFHDSVFGACLYPGEDYGLRTKGTVISLCSTPARAPTDSKLTECHPGALGDKFARIELEKHTPNMTLCIRGLQGQIKSDDIPGMVRLFRWFHIQLHASCNQLIGRCG